MVSQWMVTSRALIRVTPDAHSLKQGLANYSPRAGCSLPPVSRVFRAHTGSAPLRTVSDCFCATRAELRSGDRHRMVCNCLLSGPLQEKCTHSWSTRVAHRYPELEHQHEAGVGGAQRATGPREQNSVVEPLHSHQQPSIRPSPRCPPGLEKARLMN